MSLPSTNASVVALTVAFTTLLMLPFIVMGKNDRTYCPPEHTTGVLLEKERVNHGKGNYSNDVAVMYEQNGVKQTCRTSVSTQMFDYVEVGDKVKTLDRH